MKKKGKLKLHRETLRNLAGPGLRHAAGGTGGMDTTNACEEASWCACASEGSFCGAQTQDHTCGTVCDIPTWHC